MLSLMNHHQRRLVMGNFCQMTGGGGYDFETKRLFGRFDLARDLVYPLAGYPRFGRHTNQSWNVAIHSVAVGLCIGQFLREQGVDEADCLDGEAAGLLHDAHEAVIGDITTPVAWEIGYEKVKAVKADVQLAIEDRLNVHVKCRPINWVKHVKDADAAALHVEKMLFMAPPGRDWGLTPPGPEWMQPMHDIICTILNKGMQVDGGEAAFLAMYKSVVR